MVVATRELVEVENIVAVFVAMAEVVRVEATVEALMLIAEILGVDDVVVVQSMAVRVVEVVVMEIIAGEEEGVSSLTTTYLSFEGREVVFVMSLVTKTSKVFAGSELVTTFVVTIVSIEGGSVIAGAVTVTIAAEAFIMVVAGGIGAALGVDMAVVPPSTATTE